MVRDRLFNLVPAASRHTTRIVATPTAPFSVGEKDSQRIGQSRDCRAGVTGLRQLLDERPVDLGDGDVFERTRFGAKALKEIFHLHSRH